MEYLLSPENIAVLESFALVSPVFAFDFDGTLAPIVPQPQDARLTDEVKDYLTRLNDSSTIAVITGRRVDDVKALLGFSPKYLIGNHGIEGMHSEAELSELRHIISEIKESILRTSQAQMSVLGIQLEDKIYTLTLHYRNSPNELEARNFLENTLKNLPQVSVAPGKMVFNIVPISGLTKGQAFQRIMMKEDATFGFYIGDDVTDETVFAYDNARVMRVRVGYSPDSAARYFLKDQSEITELLRLLLQFKNLR